MARIRNCEVPEDLYYAVPQHVWARRLPSGVVRIGVTPAGYAMLLNSVVAVEILVASLGQQVQKGRSIAMIESLKYIGPVAAPFSGVLLGGNPAVEADPELAMRDPYGEGWIAEMTPDDWEIAAAGLLTGDAAVAAYRKLLDTHNLSCD
jgi:glycine cleavage system H protein